MTKEPERGAYFQPEVSLKAERRLGSSEDDRDAQNRRFPEPGANQGFSRRQRRGGLRAPRPRGSLRLACRRTFGYVRLGKADKGLLREYLAKVTRLSRAQLTRLIGQFVEHGTISDRRGRPAKPFPGHYTDQDVRLLAEIDTLQNHTDIYGRLPPVKPVFALFRLIRAERG